MKFLSRSFLFLSLIFTSALLTGCYTRTVYVDKLEYIIKTPPESLLRDCHVEPPPDPRTFIEMNPEDRETRLAQLNGIHYKSLAVCNTEKRGLRAWSKEQKALEKKANDERPK